MGARRNDQSFDNYWGCKAPKNRRKRGGKFEQFENYHCSRRAQIMQWLKWFINTGEVRSFSDYYMVSVWDWSARYCTYRRERPSLLDLLAVRFRINFWLDGWGSISLLEIGPMHLSVEGLRPWDWSYPVLQYLREWPTPTVVSSLSRVLSLNTTNQYRRGLA